MAEIAPWLKPADVLGASEAGDRLGLSQQDMIRRSDEHAAELALRADELNAQRDQNQKRLKQQQQEQGAALALRRAALQQQGLLGQARIGNEADRNSATGALDAAKIAQMNRQNLLAPTTANVREISAANLPSLMESHPEMSKADILARFPTLKESDIPTVRKTAPAKVAPLLPPGVQDQLFKQLLVNSPGSTNTDWALSRLHDYTTPTPTEDSAPAPEPSAAEQLNTQQPQSTLPDLSGVPAPSTPSKARSFTDKSGTTYIYTGSAEDPTTDKDPANWQQQGQ